MESPKKEVSYDGKDITLDASTDNEGWSTAVDSCNVKKFEGRRRNVPNSLPIDREIEFKEGNIPLREAKVVETGKGETTGLCRSDSHEIKTAKEFSKDKRGFFSRVKRVFRNDDEWIRLQRQSQENAEGKTEQDLKDFHEGKQTVSQVDSHQAAFRDSEGGEGYHVDQFLANLDDLESARPGEENEAQNVTSSIVSTRGPRRVFNDWIDETDFMEANATMPQGTRYYSVP
ncbi:hypothetical protein F4820DRAFT_454262 [Hypoxylon rubiginosum]|uniref:Uncharacterized protein n=1 Tax=Hypoxylon rubiginosum TaxID=110542 RepID=A0ACB9YIT2_9PEZI|nr:hypothetical protein F4820DRAFT_454262 [Hypoxylon rubiginosum]